MDISLCCCFTFLTSLQILPEGFIRPHIDSFAYSLQPPGCLGDIIDLEVAEDQRKARLFVQLGVTQAGEFPLRVLQGPILCAA